MKRSSQGKAKVKKPKIGASVSKPQHSSTDLNYRFVIVDNVPEEFIEREVYVMLEQVKMGVIVTWFSSSGKSKMIKDKGLLIDIYRLEVMWNVVEKYSERHEYVASCINDAKVAEKDFCKLLVFGGATGIGKTRLLIELKSLYENRVYFNNVLPILISFNLETPYTAAEENFPIEAAIATRIALQLGLYKGYGALRKAYDSGKLQLDDVLLNPPNCIVLLIDEFNSLPESKLTEFVEFLGTLVLPNSNKPLYFVVTAGTLPGKLKEIFTKSKCPGLLMPIPPLSMESMINDLEAKSLVVDKQMYRILLDICGIPRLYIQLRKQTELPSSYEKGLDILSNANIPKNVPIDVLNIVVPFALLEYPVSSTDVEWDAYISCGRAFLFPLNDRESLVTFPFYWIEPKSKYFLQLPSACRYLIKSLYWQMDLSTSSLNFEMMACMWTCLRTWLFSMLSLTLPVVYFSKYAGIEAESNFNDFQVKVEAATLFKTRKQVTDRGIEDACAWRTEEPADLKIPFIVNFDNQCGIDAIQVLHDIQDRIIVIFYQFKCYSSLEKSVVVINQLLNWIILEYGTVLRYLYFAVANYCNKPKLPTDFEELVKNGLEYFFLQGVGCKKFMTKIICDRNCIWTRGDKILINIASIDAIKMIPGIADELANRIMEELRKQKFTSVEEMIERLEKNGKLSAEAKRSLEENLIF